MAAQLSWHISVEYIGTVQYNIMMILFVLVIFLSFKSMYSSSEPSWKAIICDTAVLETTHEAAVNQFTTYLTSKSSKDLDNIDNQGRTALLSAINLNAFDVRQDFTYLILQHQVDLVNVTHSTTKASPLHEAVKIGDVIVLRLLLDFGANTEARDQDGLRAQDHAHGMLWDNKELKEVFAAHEIWKCVEDKRFVEGGYHCGDVLSCLTVSSQSESHRDSVLVVDSRKKSTFGFQSSLSLELGVLLPSNWKAIQDEELVHEVMFIQAQSCSFTDGSVEYARRQLYDPSGQPAPVSSFNARSVHEYVQTLEPRDIVQWSSPEELKSSSSILGKIILRETTRRVTEETNSTQYTILLDDHEHYAIRHNVPRSQLRLVKTRQNDGEKLDMYTRFISSAKETESTDDEYYSLFYSHNIDETAQILWILTSVLFGCTVLSMMCGYQFQTKALRPKMGYSCCCATSHQCCRSCCPRCASAFCLRPLDYVLNMFLLPWRWTEAFLKYVWTFFKWTLYATMGGARIQLEMYTRDILDASRGIVETVRSEFLLHCAAVPLNATSSQISSLIRSVMRITASAFYETPIVILLVLLIVVSVLISPTIFTSVVGAIQTCMVVLIGCLAVFRNFYSLEDPTTTRPGAVILSLTVLPLGYCVFAAHSITFLRAIISYLRLRERTANRAWFRSLKFTFEYSLRFFFNFVFVWVQPSSRLRLAKSALSGFVTVAVLFAMSLKWDDNNDGGVDVNELLSQMYRSKDDINNNLMMDYGDTDTLFGRGPWHLAFTAVVFVTVGMWSVQSFVSEQVTHLVHARKEFKAKKEHWNLLRQKSEGRRTEERLEHVKNLRAMGGLECAHCHSNIATSINLNCGHCILCNDCTKEYRIRNGAVCPVPDCSQPSQIQEMSPTLTTCFCCYQGWESSCIFRPSSIGGGDDGAGGAGGAGAAGAAGGVGGDLGETKRTSESAQRCDHLICVACMVDAVRLALREKSAISSNGTTAGLRCPMYAAGCQALILEESIRRLRDVSARVLPDSRSENSTLPLTVAEGDRFERYLEEARIPVHSRLYCINQKCYDSKGYRPLNDLGHDCRNEQPRKFECVFCDTPMCTRCKRKWHPNTFDCAKAHLEKVDVTERNILATTKACPNCDFRITHWHGHHCHHISPSTKGCPNCHCHWCYSCGTSGKKSPSYCGSSPSCRLNCIGGNGIKAHLLTSSGWPVDKRCGCAICPDCRPGKKCKQCPGNCVVCKGIVPPGTFVDELQGTCSGKVDESYLPESLQRTPIIPRKKKSVKRWNW